ncbi:hypothetical protein HK100_007405, partial [Physocladia obscura]
MMIIDEKQCFNDDKKKTKAVQVPEIVGLIFHFLSSDDIQEAQRVSQSWRRTASDTLIVREQMRLHVVLVITATGMSNTPSTNNGVLHQNFHLHSTQTQTGALRSVLTRALSMAVSQAGLDFEDPSLKSGIVNFLNSASIIKTINSAKPVATPTTFFLVPIELKCTNHELSLDSKTLTRKFQPIKSNTPQFVPDTAFLNDSCIHAIVSVNHRRGECGGLKFALKCLTGSPVSSTLRDTHPFIPEHTTATTAVITGAAATVMTANQTSRGYGSSFVYNDGSQDGYIGSVREGCFGSDFVASFTLKTVVAVPSPCQQEIVQNFPGYWIYTVADSDHSSLGTLRRQ